jgi:DNA invertase Pin-like site-specific DNA recombinase
MARTHDQATAAKGTDMAESVGTLIRVSSSGQDELNQLPELERYCDEHGYRVNKHYQLHDKSAYNGEHEAVLAEVLDDIRAGYIAALVVVHSSRLDRRGLDMAAFYELSIRMAGGRIESAREPMFGKSDITGRLVTMLAQHSNHDLSKALAGHVKAGHDRVREEGGLFGRAPFGYQIEGERYRKKLVPTPLGRTYVPQIFERVIDAESLASVAAWLNAEKVPCGTRVARDKHHQAVPGKLPTWTAATVSKIIRNPVYKGQMRDSKGNWVNSCPPIVSAAVYNRAVDRLDNVPTRRGPRNIKGLAMLSGAVYCECGSPMYRNTSAASRLYYRCAGKVTGTSCLMIRLPVVDAAADGIMARSTRPVMKPALVPGKNYDDELDAIKAQIRALDPDGPDYGERHAALMAERARLKALDTTPDRWENRPTGQTWAGIWASIPVAQRGPWLADNGFRVTASKTEVSIAHAGIVIHGPPASTAVAPRRPGC